jgi:hypothetical protein
MLLRLLAPLLVRVPDLDLTLRLSVADDQLTEAVSTEEPER